MDCKKTYQLDQYCGSQAPPCVLYKCEADQTTKVYMTIPETSPFAPSSIESNHRSEFLKALRIIGFVSVGLAVTGYLISSSTRNSSMAQTRHLKQLNIIQKLQISALRTRSKIKTFNVLTYL